MRSRSSCWRTSAGSSDCMTLLARSPFGQTWITRVAIGILRGVPRRRRCSSGCSGRRRLRVRAVRVRRRATARAARAPPDAAHRAAADAQPARQGRRAGRRRDRRVRRPADRGARRPARRRGGASAPLPTLRQAARQRADERRRDQQRRRAEERHRAAADRGARGGAPDHRGRQLRSPARRTCGAAATASGSTRAMTARARSPTRWPTPGCSTRRWTPAALMGWGKPGQGQVDHDLHQPRPRLHGRRRRALRHERARARPARAGRTTMRRRGGFVARHPAGPVAARIASARLESGRMTIPSFGICRSSATAARRASRRRGELDIATTPAARAGDRRGDGRARRRARARPARADVHGLHRPAHARADQRARRGGRLRRCRSGAARARSSACWRSPASARCCRSSTRRPTDGDAPPRARSAREVAQPRLEDA